MSSDDTLYCPDCDIDLIHDDVDTVENVPELDPETFEMGTRSAAVHRCGGCGTVLGFETEDSQAST